MTVGPQRLPAAHIEEVDGELADRPATGVALVQPTVHAAAVAATGFVASLATTVAWKGRHARRARRRGHTKGLPIVSSRSLLVDVHVLCQRR